MSIIQQTTDDPFSDFFAVVADVWKHGLLGVDIGRILIAIVIFGAALLLRNFFSKFVVAKMQNYTERTKSTVDDRIVLCLIPPIKFIPVILGLFFAGKFLHPAGEIELFFNRVIRSLIAFTIFWSIYRAIYPISHTMKRLEKILSPMMMQWMFKALRILVAFIGGAVVLEVWGIQVAPLLAGLGLFGAAVALGAQDLFRNLIGGLTIIAEKRFNPGEYIIVDGIVSGTVEDIGFRSTRVRRSDKQPVFVPNSKLSDAAVINNSRMSHRIISLTLYFGYEVTVEKLGLICNETLTYIKSNKDFVNDKSGYPAVRANTFTSAGVEVLVQCFTHTTSWDEWMKVKEGLIFEIKHIVEEKAKVSFIYPTMNVTVDQWSDKAEVPIIEEDSVKNFHSR